VQHTAAHVTQEQVEREVRGKAQDEQRKDDHCFREEQRNERCQSFGM